jgi:hypothetical protein
MPNWLDYPATRRKIRRFLADAHPCRDCGAPSDGRVHIDLSADARLEEVVADVGLLRCYALCSSCAGVVPLPGYLCELCLDAPAVHLHPALWGGEMGVCEDCRGLETGTDAHG